MVASKKARKQARARCKKVRNQRSTLITCNLASTEAPMHASKEQRFLQVGMKASKPAYGLQARIKQVIKPLKSQKLRK